MIITDKFVFIHEPKTGGTFVREALFKLWQKSSKSYFRRALQHLAIPKRRRRYKETQPYHGTCHEIPEWAQGKSILSIVRNPFDLYVCFYFFGWWATHPEDSFSDFALVKEQYPHFPDLSFEQFLALANSHFDDFSLIGSSGQPAEEQPGWYTTRFIRYYFKHPETVYRLMDDQYIQSKQYRRDMFNVHFMRTHSLNKDLYEYLRMNGYSKSELKFILDLAPARPGEQARERPSADWKTYYTPGLIDFVSRKEKLILSMFPEFNFGKAV